MLNRARRAGLGPALAVALCLTGASRPAGDDSAALTVEVREGFFREYALGTTDSGPAIVAVDRDDTVWVALARAGQLGRFQNGRLELFPLAKDSRPVGVAMGKGDGGASEVVWIAASFDDKLLRFDRRSGTYGEYPLDGDTSWPFNIALASTGEVWFSERAAGRVGRLDPVTGKVTRFDPPTPASGPAGLAVDQRTGLVWFTQSYADRLGRLDPATGEIREYVMGDDSTGLERGPAGLALAPDGGVWFAKLEGKLGHLAAGSDEIEIFDLPPAVRRPAGVAVGADGTVWFAALDGNQIVSFHPAGRHLTIYPIPTGSPDPRPEQPPVARTSRPFGIAVDGQGNVWFSQQYTGQLAVLDAAPPVVELLGPGDRPVTTASTLVTVRVEDRVAGLERMEYRVDGESVRLDAGRLWLADFPPGVKTLEVVAVDRAGHRTEVARELRYQPGHLALLEVLRSLEPAAVGSEERLADLIRLTDDLARGGVFDPAPFRAALADGERLFVSFPAARLQRLFDALAASWPQVDVRIVDGPPFFERDRLELVLGATIRWTYDPPFDGHTLSRRLHRLHITGGDRPISSPLLRAGESFTHTFDQPGLFSIEDTVAAEPARMEVLVR